MLVGLELLQSFAVRSDFAQSELKLIDLDHFTYIAGGAAVPLVLNKHGNGIFFDAKVDGIKNRFQLDSGNQTGLFLNSAFVEKHRLPQRLHATLRGYNGRGLGGDAPEAWFARLRTFELGGCYAALKSRNDDLYSSTLSAFSLHRHCTEIIDVRIKSRTKLSRKFVRDLNAKSMPMGDLERGGLA